jgi:tetratricopeptide (TPR) repeat protein
MRVLLTIVLTCLFSPSLYAQPSEKQLIHAYQTAESDEEKIKSLGQLAEHYYVHKLEKKADSVLQKQLLIAEMSQNRELIFSTLFSNIILYIGSWSSMETFDRATAFVGKGLIYAKESGHDDYVALSHARLATIFRRRGQLEKAMEEASLSFSSFGNTESDSIKAVLYNEMGDIYKAKGDLVPAYKNYNNAFDIAYTIKNIPLQSEINHRYASLYQSLGNASLAQSTLHKSLALNRENNYVEGLLNDYIDLARLTDRKEYIEKAYALADSAKSDKYKLMSKRLMLSFYMVKSGDSRLTLDYFYSNQDLLDYYKNGGISNYYWTLGNIYYYASQPDSAAWYYKMAEAELEKNYDKNSRLVIYTSLADVYAAMNDTANAIGYYEKAYQEGKQLNTASSLLPLTGSLAGLYAGKGDYRKAWIYSQETIHFKDTIQQMAAQRDVALLEVERETKKHEQDQQEAVEKKLRQTNLQYMAITIALALVFLCMLIVGMFPVSRLTIKMLGYFAFISLFEFIIVLVDGVIHRLTHGEPLKIWLIKIGVIALLVPFQHFLEHGMIKFLASRKLVEARNRFSIKKIWLSIKPKAPKEEAVAEDIEEDTAVL